MAPVSRAPGERGTRPGQHERAHELDRALALGGWDGVAKLDRSVFFSGKPGEELLLGFPKAAVR